MAEIDVTAEMITAGWLALIDVLGYRGDRSLADEDKLLLTIYRAMEEVRRKEAVVRELHRHGIADD